MESSPLSRGRFLPRVPRLWIRLRVPRVDCGVGLAPQGLVILARRVDVRARDEHAHEAGVGTERASIIAVRTGETAHLKAVLVDPDLVDKPLLIALLGPSNVSAAQRRAAWGASAAAACWAAPCGAMHAARFPTSTCRRQRPNRRPRAWPWKVSTINISPRYPSSE